MTDTSTVKRYLPWLVATALFMEQLDATIVNTAIPSIAASLDVTPLSLKSVATSYILSLAVGIPVSGWMADRFGTPYTERLRVVERYRLIDYDAAKEAQARAHKEWPQVGSYAPDPAYRGKGLQLEFTVEDPGAFTTPWKGTITYLRSANTEWYERVCAENIPQQYIDAEYYSDKDARIPTAAKPDF